MNNYLKAHSWVKSLKEQVTNPNIIVGEHTGYYSGYYHNHSFDDCARYLLPDRNDIDKLIIGSYCSIGSGAASRDGRQSRSPKPVGEHISTFLHQEDEKFEGAIDGFETLRRHCDWQWCLIGTEAMIKWVALRLAMGPLSLAAQL